jgi:hypothetical protein
MIPAAAQLALDRARAHLAQQLGVAADTIEVLGVQKQYKSTGASESPGQANGWRIRLAAGNSVYTYWVDPQGKLHAIDKHQ